MTTLTWLLRLKIKGFERCAQPFLNQELSGLDEPEFSLQQHEQLLSTQRLPWSTCLTRSLALCHRLEKKGIANSLRIGVNTDQGFHAHAWVDTLSGSFGKDGDVKFKSLQ